MKKPWYCYIVIIVFGFKLLNVNAQIDYEQIRNTDTISYYVNNPYGDKAEFTWIITGGTIVGHSSPYTADGADTIQVIWNDSNKTSANYGSLKVSEIIDWSDEASCQSEDEIINIESWVQPKATTDTSGIIVCPGESFVISIDFEGKPGYHYKWKLFEKDKPEILVEDYTADFINCVNPSTDIIIAGIENSSSTQLLYEFVVTDVQDELIDSMPGNVLEARAIIYVQPKPPVGVLKTTTHLIRR